MPVQNPEVAFMVIHQIGGLLFVNSKGRCIWNQTASENKGYADFDVCLVACNAKSLLTECEFWVNASA